ncbi:MAG: DNA-3-methyladenine glycosylase [bacterium]
MTEFPEVFLKGDTLTVAQQLIGTLLFHVSMDGPAGGIIVETEAYLGPDDQASHAFRGRTRRTETMFGPPGFAYIYLIYGMYNCLNVVTEPEGYPAAVLIRALEPCMGQDLMRRRRPRARREEELANGPGKLCQALEVERGMNGWNLRTSALRLAPGRVAGEIGAGPRIGVDYAGPWTDQPWRFYELGNRNLSR